MARYLALVSFVIVATAVVAADLERFVVSSHEEPAGVTILDRRGDLWLVAGPSDLAERLPGAVRLAEPATPMAPARTWTPLRDADPAIQDLADAVVWPDVLADIEWLVGLGNRWSFHPDIHDIALSLEARFEALGLAAELHDFDLSGTTVPNVIATQIGVTYPDSVFVICAHYDATSEEPSVAAPGADYNATGTVAVLTAARLLAGRSLECTVIYALFAGEEQFMVGSRAWAADQAAAGVNIAGALNFDMIGWWEPGVSRDLEIETNAQSRWMAEATRDCATVYADMPYVFHEGEDYWWGDFYAFWELGMAAVNHEEAFDWGAPDFNPYYHTSDDLVEHLDPDFTTGNVRVAVTVLATLAGLDTTTDAGAMPQLAAAAMSAFPNPFNGRITLAFTAPGHDGPVVVGIHDVAGRQVGTVSVVVRDGSGEATWDAVDGDGAPLAAGVYLARTVGAGPRAACRVVYVK